jgi:hypothetical protein
MLYLKACFGAVDLSDLIDGYMVKYKARRQTDVTSTLWHVFKLMAENGKAKNFINQN